MKVTVIKEPYLDRFSCCYMIQDSGTDVLVDTALYTGRHMIESVNAEPAAIICSHGHWDHIGAHKYFQDKGIKIYGHEGDAQQMSDLEYQWKLLYQQFENEFEITEARRETFWKDCGQNSKLDFLIKEGDELDFGKIRLQVYEIPGHSDGSICLYDESNGLIFTGDTVSGDGFYNGFPQINNMRKYRSTLERLKEFDVSAVYSCHSSEIHQQAEFRILLDQGLALLDWLEEETGNYLQANTDADMGPGKLADYLCSLRGKAGGSGAVITACACLKLFEDKYGAVRECCKEYIL